MHLWHRHGTSFAGGYLSVIRIDKAVADEIYLRFHMVWQEECPFLTWVLWPNCFTDLARIDELLNGIIFETVIGRKKLLRKSTLEGMFSTLKVSIERSIECLFHWYQIHFCRLNRTEIRKSLRAVRFVYQIGTVTLGPSACFPNFESWFDKVLKSMSNPVSC